MRSITVLSTMKGDTLDYLHVRGRHMVPGVRPFKLASTCCIAACLSIAHASSQCSSVHAAADDKSPALTDRLIQVHLTTTAACCISLQLGAVQA